jgi:ornithine cyclodeaminase/alanine dehydrogenase-like protein (mu-crystallin family)
VGQTQGRISARQMVLFKSIGTAVQDVMAGFMVYEEAVRQGRGQDIGEFLDLKTF